MARVPLNNFAKKLIILLILVAITCVTQINIYNTPLLRNAVRSKSEYFKFKAFLDRGKYQQHQVFNSSKVSLFPEILNCGNGERRSGYCVISNYVRAQKWPGFDETITLTTQGTANFLNHLTIVCQRWKGPISVAVYAPGADYQLAGSWVSYLRNCHENRCVNEWVTWHLVYDSNHPPNFKTFDWNSNNCAGHPKNGTNYVLNHNLSYPINVARNVARLNSVTKYILASDIELYPSSDIIPRFLKLLSKRVGKKKEVFVLPVFEVLSTVKITPVNKSDLVRLYKAKQAVSFHKFLCNFCHRIPYLEEWLQFKGYPNSLKIFKTVKRDRKLRKEDWEPFFLSTNDFPFFDELLSWNGKKNKMQVALEMCLLDYDFHILDDAFLVHSPGIKQRKLLKNDNKKRSPFMKNNMIRYAMLRRQLQNIYGKNNSCF